MKRRTFLGTTAASMLATAAAAQTAPAAWPARPITFLVPFAAGGPSDALARVLARGLTAELGQQVVIENKGGMGGLVGVTALAKAPADGYTIGMNATGPTAIAPFMLPNMPVEDKDLALLTPIALVQMVIGVSPRLPVNSVAELVAYARANPGRISYASTGPGTLSHLVMEDLAAAQGFEAVHVPYRAVGQAVLDLVAGRIQAFFAASGGVLPQVREGTVRALAVTSAERFPALPDVPTMRESGVDAEPAVAWIGLFAPAGMPAERIARISAEAERALAVPDQRRALETAGFVVVGSDPAAFRALLASDIQRWGGIIRRLGLRPEN